MNNKDMLEKIKKMSYTEFISFSHQWNVPPGSSTTINEWAIFSRINSNSRVLEIACTTGFSGRELARITGCSVVGIDICKESILRAQFNRQLYGDDLDLEYICADACTYKSDEKFTHIVLGAALGFFEEPRELISNLKDLLTDGGMILVSPYYLKGETLPNELVERTKKIIGIIPTNFGYCEAIKPYEDFELLYEARKDIIPESEEQMIKYSYDTVKKACELNNISCEEIFKCMYDRMYDIKDTCNELHKRFGYSVAVLRYRSKIFPNRFTELF